MNFRRIAEHIYDVHFRPLIRDMDQVLADRAVEEEDELYLLRRALTRIAIAPQGNKSKRRWKRKDWEHHAARMRIVAQDALAGTEVRVPHWGEEKGVLDAEIERWRAQGNPEVGHLNAMHPTERQDRDR